MGDAVERLRGEVARGINGPTVGASGTYHEYCGEDSEESVKIAPLEGDRWKVVHSPFRFRASVGLKVESHDKARPIYQGLQRHLRLVGGWEVTELRSKNGVLGGIQGRKGDVRLHAYDFPERPSGVSVYVDVESGCYRHPNA
ncbi:hypothetical protein [Actinomadura sp. 9N407]|uniref:hypothetical protein n=1 Tax=Actinomadura sp. 9N407 TaxID=3375154 RepID=UPI0037A50B5C